MLEHEIGVMILSKVANPFNEDDEPNIYWEHELASGSSESVTCTTPTDPGEYHIICGIPAHL